MIVGQNLWVYFHVDRNYLFFPLHLHSVFRLKIASRTSTIPHINYIASDSTSTVGLWTGCPSVISSWSRLASLVRLGWIQWRILHLLRMFNFQVNYWHWAFQQDVAILNWMFNIIYPWPHWPVFDYWRSTIIRLPYSMYAGYRQRWSRTFGMYYFSRSCSIFGLIKWNLWWWLPTMWFQ